jgi:hypothetical protein
MRRTVCLLTALILAGLALGACSLRKAADPLSMATFDALARRLPADVENAVFFDFRPDDETARYWEALRRRLEQNPATQQPLANLLDQFRVEVYGLKAVIEGPAAAAQWARTTVVLLPVQDEAAAWQHMIRNLGDAQSWEQTTVEGRLMYHGRFWEAGNRATHLAWTMDEDLLYLAYSYDSRSIECLSDLLGLATGATLGSLDSWKWLQQRLPEDPLAVLFVPVAEMASRPGSVSAADSPPSLEDQPPAAVLERHLEGLALAFTPEDTGLHIDIQGVFGPDAGTVPALEALFSLPAVDVEGWDHLPANAALALLSHDASATWPWIGNILGLELRSGNPLGVAVGLDLEADLLGEDGPLAGPFALAVMPPWPDQPVIQGLPAFQALLLSREVTPGHVERLAAALEERGTVLGTADVTGMEFRTQAGTQLSGYALSFGLDGGTLSVATSPQAIRQAMDAGREGTSLVRAGAFQAILSRLPVDPFLLVYIDSQRFIELVRANPGGGQEGSTEEIQFLELFEAMGVGLRLSSDQDGDATLDRVEGVVHFLLKK